MASLLIEELLKENRCNAWAFISQDNTSSIKTVQRLGFEKYGFAEYTKYLRILKISNQLNETSMLLFKRMETKETH